MSDANRPDPVAAYWDDYLRAIEPDAGASRRVRRSLDRALVDRRRAAPVEAPAQPMPRAAAAFFVIKSSALSVGLALATLGGLHVGARALAPAELPTVEPRAPVEPISAHEPIATPEARRPAASLERPSIAAPLPADAAPAIAPVRRATTRADAKPNAAPAESTPAASPPLDALRAELALMDRAKAALAAGDDARALSLLAEHAERFPAGSMIEERRGWMVIAGCREGAATARSLAESFAREYPRSVLLDDIHHACSRHSSTDSARASE
jgi:hypothetical protein